ncbi:hypothetical protein MU516_15625 [Paracoccus sp. YLB-12]|uniref:Uncharacterized protein n=1 Tax=Paracoccus maritimus TaxID=2933292 RepID=A0ABT2KEM7_9RHOB|nr:hypothetical protein [Paracoccus sp. YLB-12]MCT4334295.1 hypothetical protein [Paracoccus sp. YLB-12]
MYKLMPLVLIAALCPPTAATSQDITTDTPFQSLPRMFGERIDELQIHTTNMGIQNKGNEDSGLFSAMPFDSDIPSKINASEFAPVIVAEGDMIQTKGIFPGREFFYITDTGKDSLRNESGRIWRFDPRTNDIVKFFESSDLINPKWIFYHSREGSPDLLIVSDLGEEPIPRAPGTGRGAKIISIPIVGQGLAGEPTILFEGPPFRSPEGVTVIGETVIVSDWAAGSLTTRPEAPDDEFNQGAVFKLPLNGGEPTKLFEEHKWVTVIGACQFFDADGKRYLRIIDIDGGRIQGIDPTFPRSGTVKYFIAEVLSEDPLLLGPLTEAVMLEDTPIDLREFVVDGSEIQSVSSSTPARVLGRIDDQSQSNTSELIKTVRSPNSLERVDLIIEYKDPETASNRILTVSIPKGQLFGAVPQDNKHAGARVVQFSGVERSLSASADGTSRSVFIFPSMGGIPAVLWSGNPFQQPMGVQFSSDGESIYVTDQAAGENGMSVLFKVPLPRTSSLEIMFAP